MKLAGKHMMVEQHMAWTQADRIFYISNLPKPLIVSS